MALRPRAMPTFGFQRLNPAYQSDPRRIMGQALAQQGASSAPVRTPLQGLGRLSSALVGAYLQRNALDAQAQREAQATEALQGALPQNLTPGMAALFAANPGAAEQALMTAFLQPTTTSQIVDQNGLKAIETTTTNPITGGTTTQLSNLVQPRAQPKQDFVTLVDPKDPAKIQTLPLGDPKITTLISQGYVERQGAGTNVTVNPNVAIEAGETKFAEGMASAQIKSLEKISEDASTAGENADVINQILEIYNRVDGVTDEDLTGPGAEFLLDAQEAIIGAGRLFGFSPEDAGIDLNAISDQQSLRSAFSKLSLEMTKILKGALSNRELGVAEKATANFGNTPEANRMILLTQLAASEKLQFLESEAYRYIYGDEQNKGNGNLGPGTIDGKKYSSFAQYQREIKNDKEFMFRRMIPNLQRGDVSAFVKLLGGEDALSDELAQALASHITELQS